MNTERSKYEQFLRTEITPYGKVEVLDFKCNSIKSQSNNEKEFVIFLTPGNPGFIQIYESFLGSLFEYYEKKIRIFAAGHLGHSKIDLNNGKLFDIDSQVQKTHYFLEQLISTSDNEIQFILISHSFGSFVNTQVMLLNPTLPIVFNFFLFPVLCQLNLSLPMKVICNPVNRKWVSSLVSIMPPRAKMAITRKVVPYNKDEADIAIMHSGSASLVENALYIGNLIKDRISGELPEEMLDLFSSMKDSSVFMFTWFDRYATKSVYIYLKNKMNFARFIYIPSKENVLHAFSINEKQKIVRTIVIAELARSGILPLESNDDEGDELLFKSYLEWDDSEIRDVN